MIETIGNFEAKCKKDITYIKESYWQAMTIQQKHNLHKLEALIKQRIILINQITLQDTQETIIFTKTRKQLRAFRRHIENQQKYQKTDYDAFVLKRTKNNQQSIEILDLIKITRLDHLEISLEDLKNINFPVLGYENKELVRLASLVLKNTNYCKSQQFFGQLIDNLLVKISKNYNVASYHNFSHGFAVFLMCNQVYDLSSQAKNFVDDFELFWFLLAGLSHDLNHKSRSNMYEIKKRSHLAMEFNNQSVLQNMHVSTLFSVMNDPSVDFLSSIGDPLLVKKARKLLTRCILATDMAHHFSSLQKFKEKRLATSSSELSCCDKNEDQSLNPKCDEDRSVILDCVIHACDISNPCLSFENYMNWAALLSYEFNQQYKREQMRGLQVTPFLRYVDRSTFYKSQCGFASNFAAPLWRQISLFSVSLSIFYEQLLKNIQELRKRFEM